MQKINKIVIAILISLYTISCGRGFKYTKVMEGDDYSIYYINSKKIGERVKSKLVVENITYQYHIYIGYKGRPNHIIKYGPEDREPKKILDYYRTMEFLVSDTSKNTPNYLSNEINDYYDPSFFKGRYEVTKLNRKVSPVSAKEYEMLHTIATILASKKVEFEPVDSTKVIGWFKYEF